MYRRVNLPHQDDNYRKGHPKRNLTSFSTYCTSALKDSMLNGITSVVKAKGCFQRFLRIIFLVFSISGFLYQTFQFMQLYWRYETVVMVQDIDVMTKPALTICDGNLFRRTFVCKNMPDICTFYDDLEDFCAKFEAYCEGPKHKIVPAVVNTGHYDELLILSQKERDTFQPWTNVINCTWISYDPALSGKAKSGCSNPTMVRGMNKMKIPVTCFTFDSNIGNKNDIEYFTFDHLLRLQLKWDHDESLDLDKPRRYFLAIHHPKKLQNPMTEGFAVDEGTHYKVDVRQIDDVRLPPPYTTHCRDYLLEWNKRGGRGPINREDCCNECDIQLQHLKLECVFRDITYPHDRQLCLGSEVLDNELFWQSEKCQEACKEACNETSYETDLDVSSLITKEEAINTTGYPSIVIVDIEFCMKESVIRTFMPKYESVELFGYIGGYLGMWLGWSLVAILDFFEVIIRLIKYPFMKRRKRKTFSTKMPHFVI